MKKEIEIKVKFTLEGILAYMEKTKPESWCVDVVKSKDGRNCFYGHIFDMGGSALFNEFENIATTYMIYPVNDGNNPKYQQGTAKERCCAYLKNIIDGKEKTTYELMFEDEENWKKENI